VDKGKNIRNAEATGWEAMSNCLIILGTVSVRPFALQVTVKKNVSSRQLYGKFLAESQATST
jgi:hypothetical protein